ncbi:MAG: 4-phosphopantoate--beta-alanine ligase [Methanothermobacter sp.]|nr:4-phosphopantoate--beta-alanine ligase [Methanothermobacter sp.]
MVEKGHPRYKSLKLREKILEAYHKGVLADAGIIAHGRGEAFDYLIGERTRKPATQAIKAAAALLLLAKNPVLSVNGNTAALVPEEIVELARLLNAKIEINLFHRTPKRVKLIEKILKEAGAKEVFGTEDEKLKYLQGIKSPRATASPKGIYIADVVLVPLEDGDRAEMLKKAGKTIITVDLNPLSRTSQNADISITDNIVRAIPLLIRYVKKLKDYNKDELKKILEGFNNKKNLEHMLRLIDLQRMRKL